MSKCERVVADALTADTTLGKDCSGNTVKAGATLATCADLNGVAEGAQNASDEALKKAEEAKESADNAKEVVDDALEKAEQALEENKEDITDIKVSDGKLVGTQRNGSTKDLTITPKDIAEEIIDDETIAMNDEGKISVDKKQLADDLAGDSLEATEDGKLNVKSDDIIGDGLKTDDDGKIMPDLDELAGNGLKVTEGGKLDVVPNDLVDDDKLTVNDKGKITLSDDALGDTVTGLGIDEKGNFYIQKADGSRENKASIKAGKGVIITTDENGNMVVSVEKPTITSESSTAGVTLTIKQGEHTSETLIKAKDINGLIKAPIKMLDIEGDNLVITTGSGAKVSMPLSKLPKTNGDRVQEFEIAGTKLVIRNEDGSTAFLSKADLEAFLNLDDRFNTDQVVDVQVQNGSLSIVNEDGSIASLPLTRLAPELAKLLQNILNFDQATVSYDSAAKRIKLVNEDGSLSYITKENFTDMLSGIFMKESEVDDKLDARKPSLTLDEGENKLKFNDGTKETEVDLSKYVGADSLGGCEIKDPVILWEGRDRSETGWLSPQPYDAICIITERMIGQIQPVKQTECFFVHPREAERADVNCCDSDNVDCNASSGNFACGDLFCWHDYSNRGYFKARRRWGTGNDYLSGGRVFVKVIGGFYTEKGY